MYFNYSLSQPFLIMRKAAKSFIVRNYIRLAIICLLFIVSALYFLPVERSAEPSSAASLPYNHTRDISCDYYWQKNEGASEKCDVCCC